MNKVVITGMNTAELPKLTSREIEDMLKRMKNGEYELRETFLLANVRLVLSMVQRFPQANRIADDIFQIGMLGLIKAADNFDITMNVRFSTYAVPMILGEIKRFIRECSIMKIGRSLRDIAYKAMIARDRIEREKVKEAELEEIAEEIDVSYKDLVFALDAIAEPISIYEPMYGEDTDGMRIIDQIANKKKELGHDDLIVLREQLGVLPEKERMVIMHRYYNGLTQTEIADEFNISQAQVSRLEKSAINKLRPAFYNQN
ncbi:MAG: sigma-70 family RNA polymerase sigma factor [Christensenellaceae bacterium]|jgi:RNA polymerase sporulation-specific sigma factor|nr:sigma-70 family RNA polymerase sigma factor [Christensenellaceae bacterium]